jgi:hypothetical protein
VWPDPVRALLIVTIALAGCGPISAAPGNDAGRDVDAGGGGAPADAGGQTDSGMIDAGATDAGATDAGSTDGGPTDAGVPALDAGLPDAGAVDTLDANRTRLLGTYLAFLDQNPTAVQSNGLSGAAVADVCELWSKLDRSAKSVFLTLTHRLQLGRLRDGSSMLWHVRQAYRVVGGQLAQLVPPGGCGHREYNRLILSIDPTLHAALVAAYDEKGGAAPARHLAEATASFWRETHDDGGPHLPFDLSDETEQGWPRGQVHFFRDPASPLANAPLNRTDLQTLVDPYALEIDQDYDCQHFSNPECLYSTYVDGCFPQLLKKGADLYVASLGDFGPSWRPSGCP